MYCGSCNALIWPQYCESGAGVRAVCSAYGSSRRCRFRMTVSCTICSVSPGTPIRRFTIFRSGVESSTTRSLPPSRSSAEASVVEHSRRFDPVGDEDVGLSLNLSVPIRRPHELMPIGRKHREGVELDVRRDLLQPLAVGVDHIQIEVA